VTSDEAKKTKLPVGMTIGGGFVLLGLLGLACALASSVSQPPPTPAHLMFLILSSTCIMAGMQVCAASYIADRNEVKVEQLMTQVEACNYVLRQLSAAPTVRLEEAKREIRAMEDSILDAVEAAAQVQTNRAVDRICKTFEERFDELDRNLAEAKQAAAAAYVDSLGENPATLRAVPPQRGRWPQEPAN
jgi:Na+/phosphate symporter